MRVVFMGTPDFAVPSLQALIDSGIEVIALVTQPDRPRGRGRKLVAPPTKLLAEARGIPVLQPEKIKTPEFLAELRSLAPDMICVTAYGKILPRAVLDLPPRGCINVHASLLPRLRGAAPINWAIIRGDTATGVTTMLMDEGMDTGGVLLRREVPIGDDDTAGSLSTRLAELGAALLIETIEALGRRDISPTPQDDSLATLAPMMKKETGRIDWSRPAGGIRSLVRGVNPWPGAFTTLGGKMLKVYSAAVCPGTAEPGRVLRASGDELTVGTGEGALRLIELQLEGGKRLGAAEFLRGRKVAEGELLGG